jgi:hypothetical protein
MLYLFHFPIFVPYSYRPSCLISDLTTATIASVLRSMLWACCCHCSSLVPSFCLASVWFGHWLLWLSYNVLLVPAAVILVVVAIAIILVNVAFIVLLFHAMSSYPCYILPVLCAVIIVVSAIKIVGYAPCRVCRGRVLIAFLCLSYLLCSACQRPLPPKCAPWYVD